MDGRGLGVTSLDTEVCRTARDRFFTNHSQVSQLVIRLMLMLMFIITFVVSGIIVTDKLHTSNCSDIVVIISQLLWLSVNMCKWLHQSAIA